MRLIRFLVERRAGFIVATVVFIVVTMLMVWLAEVQPHLLALTIGVAVVNGWMYGNVEVLRKSHVAQEEVKRRLLRAIVPLPRCVVCGRSFCEYEDLKYHMLEHEP